MWCDERVCVRVCVCVVCGSACVCVCVCECLCVWCVVARGVCVAGCEK